MKSDKNNKDKYLKLQQQKDVDALLAEGSDDDEEEEDEYIKSLYNQNTASGAAVGVPPTSKPVPVSNGQEISTTRSGAANNIFTTSKPALN
jgi:hypothetical protein